MKSYDVQNYIRYKTDLAAANKNNFKDCFSQYTRDDLIIKFLPLVENIAKKFSTTSQASGILDITDLIQFGTIGLILSIDKIEWPNIVDSNDPEKTIKSFLSKRIKGSIRRSIDIHGTSMKIPEHKLIQMRKDPSDDKELVSKFFNSIFLSIDEMYLDGDDNNGFETKAHQVEDKSEPYKNGLLNLYLTSLLKKHLDSVEFDVLRLSYGLDCDKHTANEIAKFLNIEGHNAYVKISEIKRQSIKKLIANVDSSQVIDYL